MTDQNNYATTKRLLIFILCCVILSFILKIIDNSLKQDTDDKLKISWTPESIKKMRIGLQNGLGDAFTDSDRNKITDCILGKLKNRYPKGLDDVNKDSLEKQTELLGEDCIKNMVLHFKWSQKLINKLKEKATTAAWFKSVKEEDKDKFCNCYVDHLKQMHPNGLVGRLQQSDVDSAVTYCKNKFRK
jgi:hypothetical protein